MDSINPDTKEVLLREYTSTNELLRHYWSAFQTNNNEKLTRLKDLILQQINNLTKLQKTYTNDSGIIEHMLPCLRKTSSNHKIKQEKKNDDIILLN